MKNVVLVSSMLMLLSACGSAVKLDDVKVEDKTGVAVVSPSSVTPDVGGVRSAEINSNSTNAQATVAPAASRIIYFDYDSFVVRPEFQALIETHAKYIVSNKIPRVMIEGHTDERGGREYNLSLGQKRAESVRKSFSLLGVAESQMEAVSYGKEKPAVVGVSEEAMGKNRRSEISYR